MKYFLLTILTSFQFLFSAATTTYEIERIKCHLGFGGNKVLSLLDGNLLVVGTCFHENAIFSSPSWGFGDVSVVKLDSNYNIIWAKRYGSSAFDTGYDAIENDDGTITVLAHINYVGWLLDTTVASGQVSKPLGLEDVWLFQIDNNGNLLWEKTIGTSDGDVAQSMAKAPNGDLLLIGSTFGNDGHFTGHKGIPGYHLDWMLCRLDKYGNYKWSKLIGGSHNDADIYITATGNDTYMLTGMTTSLDGDCTNTDGNFLVKASDTLGISNWIAKIDGDGNFIWTTRMRSGVSIIYPNNLTQPIYVNGVLTIPYHTLNYNESVTCTPGLVGSGAIGVWVVQIDTNSNIRWQYCMNGDDLDLRTRIVYWKGMYVLATETRSVLGDFYVINPYNTNYYDIAITLIDTNGNRILQKRPKQKLLPDNTPLSGMSVFHDKVVFCHSSKFVVDSCEGRDVDFSPASFEELISIESVDPVNRDTSSLFTASVFPNPYSDNITIDLGNYNMHEPVIMVMQSIGGNVIYKKVLFQNKTQFSIPNISSGMYFLSLLNGKQNISLKLIKI
ncbi:MAG: T9SS type A sorting domain-containing protein [Chitinophagaceae bacterium]